MPDGRAPLQDDRGREVGLLDWTELDPASPRNADLRRRLDAAVADPTADARSLGPGTIGCLAKGVVFATLAAVIVGGLRWIGVTISPGWMSVIVLGLILPVLRIPADRWIDNIANRFIGRNRFPRVAQIALGHWTCPGCGYSLEALEVHPDGCRVCPECGGAWRESRIQTLVEATRPKPVQPS